MTTPNVRRKFLRGSLAAPMVLTVSSASAATTSFARCLLNTPTQTDAPFFATTGDMWFRRQVQVDELWKGGSQGYYFLDQVKNVYVSVNAPYTALSFGSYLDNGWKINSSSTRWALVWFDKASTTEYSKISIQQPSGSAAASMSCYGSFNKA
jgi:hypothetical protein